MAARKGSFTGRRWASTATSKASRRGGLGVDGLRRLHDRARRPPGPVRHFAQRFRLEEDDGRGQAQAELVVGAGAGVTVEIRPGEGEHDRRARLLLGSRAMEARALAPRAGRPARRRPGRRTPRSRSRGARARRAGRAQRSAVTRLPLRERGGAGVTMQIFMAQRAGAEAGPDVAAVGRVEVAPGVAEQARARRPAAAAQHLVVAEPRLGVLPVGVDARSPG